MNTITRYILRQLILGVVFVAGVLATLLWLTQSLRFVELIVKKGLSPGAFFYLTSLLMPNFLAIVLPIALFAVVLFSYNRLMLDRELVVMRAAGMSNIALAKPVLILAGLSVLLGFLLNLRVVPWSVREFREIQWAIRSDYSTVLLQEGVFNSINDKLIVYVRERNDTGELLGLLVHDTHDPDKPVTMMAERGALIRSETGPRVLMINGNRQTIERGTGQMSILYFDSYSVDLGKGDVSEGARFRDARERNMAELFLTSANEIGQLDANRFRVEAHQRITGPFLNLTFAVIALACLLSGEFNRQGQLRQVLLAIALMVLVQTANLGIVTGAARQLALLPLLYVNVLAPIMIGLAVLVFPMRLGRRIPAKALPA